jgi:antirestriction protein ArdC
MNINLFFNKLVFLKHIPEQMTELFIAAGSYFPVEEVIEIYEVNPSYRTLFHELSHWTGHAKRLKRRGIYLLWNRSNYDARKEEVIADYSAYLLLKKLKLLTKSEKKSIDIYIKRQKLTKQQLKSAKKEAKLAANYIVKNVLPKVL